MAGHRSALILALALGACATTAHEDPGPRSFAAASGAPAPAQARFYADCIAQAAAAHSYDREQNWIRFHCAGAPAQAFFDGLAGWSAHKGSEYSADGRTYRFTDTMNHDPSGLDYCWRSDAEYGCTIVLNAGDYLASP